MPTISTNVLDQKTGNENKTVYLKPNGQDAFDGNTMPTAVLTQAQAITLANAKSPTPSDPVAIYADAAEVYSETIIAPTAVNFDQRSIRLVASSAGAIFQGANNNRVFFDSIENTGAGQAILLDNNLVDLFQCTLVQAVGTCIEFSNSSAFHFINIDAITTQGIGILNGSAAPFWVCAVDSDALSLNANGAIGIQNTGSSEGTFDIDIIEAISGATGTVGIDVDAGVVRYQGNRITTATAIDVANGAQADVRVGTISGDINVDAGGTLNIWCENYTGTVTNNGTINGFIGDTYYGNADVGTVDSVNSGTNITVDNADPKNPIVNLNASITSTTVNGVNLTTGGVATNYLDETGNYSVPPTTPGGADTQVQFNDAGVLGGDADFTYDKSGNVLNVAGSVDSPAHVIEGSTSGTVKFDGPATITSYTLTWPDAAPTEDDSAALFTTAGVGSFKQVVPDQVDIDAGSSPYTITDTLENIFCDMSSGAIVINLPPLVAGNRYVIKKISGSNANLTINADGSDVIDGSASVNSNSALASVTLVGNATEWSIV